MQEYTLEIKQAALKAILRLPKTIQARIHARIEGLKSDPRPKSCRKLEGEERAYRVRLGDYRIVYEVWDKQIHVIVINVGHRKDIYR